MAIRGGPSQTAAGRGSGGEDAGLRAHFLKSTGVQPRFTTRPSRPLQKTRHTEDASVASPPSKALFTMKRKAEADESAPQPSPEPERGASRAKAKRPRIQDAQSVRQQAVRYQLATAKMPLDALTCTWKNGINRQINRQHVSRLCRMFRQGTLARQSEEHFLLVQCSSAAAQRMLDRQSEQEVAQKEGEVLAFDDWLAVNGDEKAEVMAGQHRIEALREYVKETRSGSKDLWWPCILYDEGEMGPNAPKKLGRLTRSPATLPPELNVQLRVNRRDPNLPDSHGQIWTQLVLAAGQDNRLFCGKKEDVKAQMLDVLRLSSEDRFPLDRLVTLWNNDRWRSMITRWCESELGRATLNISTFDWMASYRIDNVRLFASPRGGNDWLIRDVARRAVLVLNVRAGAGYPEGAARQCA